MTAASPEKTLHLDALDRIRLAHLPTPLEPAPRLARALGVRPSLFIKRDDCTGLGLGGNKTRKLEFTLGDAVAKGADLLVTSGGLQSNHVRQTAAAAARLGLGCHAVVSNPLAEPSAAYLESGNILLDDLFGAVLHVTTEEEVEGRAEVLMRELTLAGRRPYHVPLGASDGVGAVGYVLCAHELLAQADDLDLDLSHIVLCTGSAGTHAGLLTGLRLAGSPVKVVGVSSSEPSAVKVDKVRRICRETLRHLGEAEWGGLDADVDVSDRYVGAGYGMQTEAAGAAIRLVAATEGIVLDPVYTGKAMAGLIDMLARGELKDARDIVFLHTGGAPALFAYPHAFAQSSDIRRG